MNDIILIVLTSTVISGIMSFILKIAFENKQQLTFTKELGELKRKYDIEIEQIKTELVVYTTIQNEITTRRFDCYPQIVEIVYRLRNMSRELCHSEAASVLHDEFKIRTIELENDLYKYRADLERDHVFKQIHSYKNQIKNFDFVLKDLFFWINSDPEGEKLLETRKQLENSYIEIDASHVIIVESLKNYLSMEQNSIQ